MKTETLIERLFSQAGIAVNGNQPWDIRVNDDRFYEMAVKQGAKGLGDSYVLGYWDCDDIPGMSDRLSRKIRYNMPRTTGIVEDQQISETDRRKSMEVVDDHYEMGNAFYTRMLDPYMQYTCAYWKDKTDTLEQAQLNKMALIAKKLDIQPGNTLLDIGCGWAGMGKYLTANYDCQYTGINLAQSHIDYARNVMCKDNDRVKIIKQDYRDTQESFDRIFCVGVSEHFGREYYRLFFETVHKNLKKGGVFLLHTVCDNVTRLHMDTWIEETGLPNTYLPSIKLVSQSAEGLFVTEDVHNLNIDYAKTMIAWEANVRQNWNLIRADLPELDNSQFQRRWRYFMLFGAGQFFSRRLQVYQFVFTKVEDGRPYPTPTYQW